MNQKLSKLLRDPIGVLGRRVSKLMTRLRYAKKDGYRAEEYWRARHGRYGFDLRGVGDYTMTQEENQRILDEGKRLVLDLVRREGIDLGKTAMLDVGCGTGFYAGVFREAGVKSYVGVDIVDTLFDGLRQRLPGLRFEQVNVGTMSLPEGKYDLITMMDVAQHITGEREFLHAMENLKSHLAPGGVIIISTIIGPHERHQFYVTSRPLSMFREIFAGFRISEPLPFCGNQMFSLRK